MRRHLILAALMGCADPSGADSASPVEGDGVQWSIVDENISAGAYLSVWGASAEDVWIVGGQHDAGSLLRGSGQTWSPAALPEGTPLLNWVHGTGSDDVWVAGLQGTLLHWDGAEWVDHSVQTDAAFWGLFARSPDEVVAVGGASRWGGEAAMIYSFDGEQWSEQALPETASGLGNLFKVFHDGTQYWLVGAGGAAMVGDIDVGFTSAPTGFAGDLVTITGDPVVAVGGRGTGLIMEADGGRLVSGPQTNAGLNGVRVYPGGIAIVVGEFGYSAIYDLTDGSLEPIPSVTTDILHATWGGPGGEMYAVGGNLNTAEEYFHGVILNGRAPE